MRFFHTLFAISGFAFLTACGGGGGSLGGGSGAGGASAALNYTPVFRTAEGDLIEQSVALDESLRGIAGHSSEQGATGVMAIATFLDGSPEFRSFKVWLSSDRSQAFLQIQGAPLVTLDLEIGGSAIGGTYGENALEEQQISLLHGASDSGLFGYVDTRNLLASRNGAGVYGLETPVAELPGNATYTGTVSASSYVSSLSATDVLGIDGTFSMNVDFSGGGITGTTGGQLFFNGVLSASTGTVSGSVTGNGLLGTFTFDGGGHSAETTFAGKAYGWTADEIGGAVIGTFDGQPVFGEFEGDSF